MPLSFIEEYVYGIRVEFDDKEMLLSLLRETERNEAGRFVEKNVEFKLKEERTSTSLPENELTEEIKEKCIFITVTPDGATSDVVDGGIG